jgi:hypothetical protein
MAQLALRDKFARIQDSPNREIVQGLGMRVYEEDDDRGYDTFGLVASKKS